MQFDRQGLGKDIGFKKPRDAHQSAAAFNPSPAFGRKYTMRSSSVGEGRA
jgi:hypothetical protein